MREETGVVIRSSDHGEQFKSIKHSQVIKKILLSLINVTQDKTTKNYAWSIVKNLLGDLEKNYDFLKYVKICELDDLDTELESITVLSDIDQVNPIELGKAIQNLIDIFKIRMGNKAGYYFIEDFKNDLGDEYHLIIKKMGVDLRLTSIQNEISDFKGSNFKIKDDASSNIAFLEPK